VLCTSEAGRIVATLVAPCEAPGSEVSFTIENVVNSPSLVPSPSLTAHRTSKAYNRIDEYEGSIRVSNVDLAILRNEDMYLDQAEKDFGVESLFSIRFTPFNPIPQVGWVKVVYPEIVTVPDEDAFVASCNAVTSLSFAGAKHCMLNSADREVWFFDIFRDQDLFTSEMALNMYFTNPVSNFFQGVADVDLAFHVTTYDFDLQQFTALPDTGFSDAAVSNFIANVRSDPIQFAKGIDI
jgi:hypothetical protein